MTQDTFNAHAAHFLSKMTDTLVAKAKDYSDGKEDRLLNFKEMAQEAGIDPREVCLVLMLKHWSSIKRHIAGMECKTEGIKERLVDFANYVILLSALEEDRVAT